MSDKSWEPGKLAKLALSHSLTLDMLNNFCFHVYAQKSLLHSCTLTFSISHSLTLDMLNNFCFHLYAQKSLIIAENCNGFFGPHHHHPHLLLQSSQSWFPAKNYRRRLPDLGRCHMGHGRLLLYMLYDWETKRWAESHLKLTVLASKLL